MKSEILSYAQFSELWQMLPEYASIRNPELIYNSNNDGFSLSTLYSKCHPYRNGHSFVICIVKTMKDQIFGFYADKMLKKMPYTYQGTSDCFVFAFPQKQESKVWYTNNTNSRYLLCQLEYISMGGAGNGPAIYLDESLQKG